MADTLKLIIPTNSGGHMAHAHVFARYYERYLGENVVVQAMPGASGIVAANYLYNVAKKDGSEIGTLHTQAFVSAIMAGQNIRYDLTQFSWIGSAVNGRFEPYIVWKRADADKLVIGTNNAVDISSVRVINNLLGYSIVEQPGYAGPNDVKLAVERGEVTGIIQSLTGTRTISPDWLKNPKYVPLLQYGNGKIRHPEFLSVPTLAELMSDSSKEQTLELFEFTSVFLRSFAAPPSVPQKRIDALRTAFEKTMKDLDYIQDAKKIGVNVSPIYGAEAELLITRMMSLKDHAGALTR